MFDTATSDIHLLASKTDRDVASKTVLFAIVQVAI